MTWTLLLPFVMAIAVLAVAAFRWRHHPLAFTSICSLILAVAAAMCWLAADQVLLESPFRNLVKSTGWACLAIIVVFAVRYYISNHERHWS